MVQKKAGWVWNQENLGSNPSSITHYVDKLGQVT